MSMLLQDIELSKEINESFKQSSQARTKLPSGIEMSVHVLTTGWVKVPIVHCSALFLNLSAAHGILEDFNLYFNGWFSGTGQHIHLWMSGFRMN